MQLQLLIHDGTWDKFLDLQPLPAEPGRIGFCWRIAEDSAQGDQLCHRAAQIINGCAEFPRGSSTPLLGQWVCTWWSFSVPWLTELHKCVFAGRTEGFAVPSGFPVLFPGLSWRSCDSAEHWAVFALGWVSQQVPTECSPAPGGTSLGTLV